MVHNRFKPSVVLGHAVISFIKQIIKNGGMDAVEYALFENPERGVGIGAESIFGQGVGKYTFLKGLVTDPAEIKINTGLPRYRASRVIFVPIFTLQSDRTLLRMHRLRLPRRYQCAWQWRRTG